MSTSVPNPKFAELHRLIREAQTGELELDIVVVAWPEALGDTYDEIIENLGLLADAKLELGIAGRKP